ncbi:hypothetical protein M409DRAFT_67109 [Zasmidium cellare ATCC 36951]|uniref:Enoyl reductase (ER) domain-containing protein n=1 Tax=Zasmidium cellare ATCC 36951 TaxID=1080233 RepID=A0A6A6CHW7_ZASCE|nr:uncharacterized protein M409DRAFT_67109 [Zasmidium cellare ATCC 36951]KAF2165780.1 hypothetical protein M409DRAFT_67109 [Zasmidium cellare ATCC 36951]
MTNPKNQAAWLHKPDTPLEVGDAPMPTAGPGEIVVKNAAVAINPLDTHMQDVGVFVQQWPACFGCDVAGEVYEVGADVERFKKGDRVVGHCINLTTGQARDGAYQLYSVVLASKAAILPDSISFKDSVVVPFALEAAVCALSLKEPGIAMPGVSTPALGLPYPSLDAPANSLNKTLIVYGGSSSVGSMVTQLGTAAGITIISIASPKNFDLCKRCGAEQVIDRDDPNLVASVLASVPKGSSVVGIFDAVSSPDTYAHDLAILEKVGGGHLAAVHPPPSEGVPSNVQAGMIFAVNDIAGKVFEEYATPALEKGKVLPLPPPKVVGKGLDKIDEALKLCKAGVSATKLVVEL